VFSVLSGLAAAVTIASGAPAAPLPADAFAALLPAECESEDGERYLPRRKLVEHVLKDHPLFVNAAAFGGPAVPVGQQIAGACRDGKCGDDGYAVLNRLASAMLQQRADAQFQLVWTGPEAEPVSVSDRIAAFYDLGRATYRIRCLGAPPPPPIVPQVVASLPEAHGPVKVAQEKPAMRRGLFAALSKLRVASSVTETDKSDYTKRDPAKLSYVSNAASGDAQLSVKAALVTPPIASWGNPDDKVAGYGTVKPYVSYERISSRLNTSNVNNVDFGLRGQYRFGRYDDLPAFNGSLSAAYETDDRFKSALTRVEASLSPPWATWLRERHLISGGKGCVWCQSSGLTLVSDYAKVGNPGDKTALDDLPQYARVGFDAGYSVQWKPHPDLASFGLDVSFADRQDFTGNGATATRLTTRATYYPSASSHVVLGLQYDKGKDLTSLTNVDNWMITWGYRQ